MSADEKARSDSVRMLPSALRLKLSAVAELEAGPLSQWLCSALAEAELPVVCVETRHMQAVAAVSANWTMPRRTRPLPERANPFSRRFLPLSSGEPASRLPHLSEVKRSQWDGVTCLMTTPGVGPVVRVDKRPDGNLQACGPANVEESRPGRPQSSHQSRHGRHSYLLNCS